MRLAELREKANITQREFAFMLNVASATISRWENGYCEPSFKTKVEIAGILGVTVEELCDGDWRTVNTPLAAVNTKGRILKLSLLEKAVQIAHRYGMTYAELQKQETLGYLKIKGDRLLIQGVDY